VDIIILHRNLRLEDNSALFHGSVNQNYRVIYVYDKHYWSSDGRSPRQFSFLMDCMKEVQSGLRSLNSYIEVFEGSYSNYRLILRETTLSQRFTLITQLILRITEIKLVNSKILSRGHQDLMYMKILEYKLTNLTEISGLLIGIGK